MRAELRAVTAAMHTLQADARARLRYVEHLEVV